MCDVHHFLNEIENLNMFERQKNMRNESKFEYYC